MKKGADVNNTIRNYLISALFEDYMDDIEFISLYSGKVAIKNIYFL
jgi:hypothetical protein